MDPTWDEIISAASLSEEAVVETLAIYDNHGLREYIAYLDREIYRVEQLMRRGTATKARRVRAVFANEQQRRAS